MILYYLLILNVNLVRCYTTAPPWATPEPRRGTRLVKTAQGNHLLTLLEPAQPGSSPQLQTGSPQEQTQGQRQLYTKRGGFGGKP